MSIGEEQTECPLCMEQLEMDDISFFPCTCGYQICRFCWHRIRTDENGLCPACRKQYPEDPAEFKPLTEDELQRIKKERRQKDLQRKQKAAENRKHLANVRVVQKNLVFVVGLSQRLADAEVLKKHEYFGKFGKIHKVVINQSTSYAGAQGPSASAYVTYHRPEDALRAIQAVNNVFVDGRTLKASLGTTKYCSHFLKGAQCPKPDCMYLHELGEEAASFTKEEMQQGKHQEYEQKLYEQFMNSVNLTNHQTTATTKSQTTGTATNSSSRKKTSSPTLSQQQSLQQSQPSPPLPQSQPSPPLPASISPLSHSPPITHPPPNSNKEAWPSLSSSGGSNGKPERLTNGNKSAPHGSPPSTHKQDSQNGQNRAPGNNRSRHIHPDITTHNGKTEGAQNELRGSPTNLPPQNSLLNPIGMSRKSPFDSGADSMSLFSSNGFPSSRNKPVIQPQNTENPPVPHTEIPDTIPVSHSVDWQAAFGFPSNSAETLSNDDDLGFDPWDESSKALADLIEKETNINSYLHAQNMPEQNRPRNLPPGFTSNHIGAYTVNPGRTDIRGSKMMGLMSFSALPQNSQMQNTFHDVLSDISLNKDGGAASNPQDGLRALLPNINISFGAPPHSQFHNHHPAASAAGPSPTSTQQQQQQHHHQQQQQKQQQMHQQAFMQAQRTQSPESEWLTYDPAIVTSGNITESLSDDPPHWMRSLQQLTEVETAPTHNHRLPFVHSFPFRAPPSWPQQNTQLPPPGFQSPQLRPHTQLTDSQQLGGLQ